MAEHATIAGTAAGKKPSKPRNLVHLCYRHHQSRPIVNARSVVGNWQEIFQSANTAALMLPG
jgi:hypothetical protein